MEARTAEPICRKLQQQGYPAAPPARTAGIGFRASAGAGHAQAAAWPAQHQAARFGIEWAASCGRPRQLLWSTTEPTQQRPARRRTAAHPPEPAPPALCSQPASPSARTAPAPPARRDRAAARPGHLPAGPVLLFFVCSAGQLVHRPARAEANRGSRNPGGVFAGRRQKPVQGRIRRRRPPRPGGSKA